MNWELDLPNRLDLGGQWHLAVATTNRIANVPSQRVMDLFGDTRPAAQRLERVAERMKNHLPVPDPAAGAAPQIARKPLSQGPTTPTVMIRFETRKEPLIRVISDIVAVDEKACLHDVGMQRNDAPRAGGLDALTLVVVADAHKRPVRLVPVHVVDSQLAKLFESSTGRQRQHRHPGGCLATAGGITFTPRVDRRAEDPCEFILSEGATTDIGDLGFGDLQTARDVLRQVAGVIRGLLEGADEAYFLRDRGML